jgi:carotenoid cleavage dioxygenase
VTYAWNRTRGASDLLVLDALDLAAGPVAAVELPVRVPYGFHGTWVPEPA